MFCCYCGGSLPDDAKFCAFCGKTITVNNADPQSVPVRPASTPDNDQHSAFTPAAPECQNPPKSGNENSGYRLTQYGASAPPVRPPKKEHTLTYREVFHLNWRAFVTSPMVIITALLFCIVSVMSMIVAQETFDQVYAALELFHLDELTTRLNLIQFFTFVPNILIGLGMMIVIADGFRSSSEPVSTVGLHIIRITLIVVYVVLSLFFVEMICRLLILSNQLDSISRILGGDRDSNPLGTVIFILIAVFSILLFYGISIINILKNTIYGIQNGGTYNSLIITIAVFQFIAAGISFIAMFSSGEIDFLPLLSAISSLFFGIVLILYNNMLDNTYYQQSTYNRR